MTTPTPNPTTVKIPRSVLHEIAQWVALQNRTTAEDRAATMGAIICTAHVLDALERAGVTELVNLDLTDIKMYPPE